MKRIIYSLLLLLFVINSKTYSQTVRIEVDGENLYYSEGGCGDCNGGPDPRFRTRVSVDGVNWYYWQVDQDNISCGWRGLTNFSWTPSISGIPYTNSVLTDIGSYEADGGTCGADDASCGGYGSGAPASTAITSGPPCSWNYWLTNRDCRSDGTTGSWSTYWSYYWYYESITGGTINGTQTICSGGDPSILGSVADGPPYVSYDWQYQDNCTGAWTSTGGTGTTYDPPAGLTNTRCYRRRDYTCGGLAADQYSNTVTVTVNTLSTAATSISGTTVICPSDSTTLSVSGGSLGSGASWRWYTGSCGGTLVGTGASITVSPAVPTTYYVRAEGTCNTTACVSTTVTLNTSSTAPTSALGGTTICPSGSATLTVNGGSLGTGATWRWYSGSCGGTSIGSGASISVSPGSTTTYYVRAEGTCGNTACQSTTVIVDTNSTAPTGISGTSTICSGGSSTLSVSGGSLGTGANWQWYSGSCGGTAVGSGPSVIVNPGSNTTYYVRAEGTCNTTTCASQLVTINTLSTNPVSLSATSPICVGDTNTITINGGTLGTDAKWYLYLGGSCGGTAIDSTIGNTFTVSPTATTTYSVNASGVCNTTSCVSATITVNTLNVAPSSVNTTATHICPGGSATLTQVDGALGTGAGSRFEWYTSSCGGVSAGTGASIVVSPASSTTYYVRAEGGCNTTACSQVNIIVDTPSVAPSGVTGTSPICLGQTTTLNLVGGSLGTGGVITWYANACGAGGSIGTGPSVLVAPTSTTSYYVRVEGTCNTTACASTTITVNDTSVTPVSITGTTSICAGSSTTLSVSGGSLGVGANWNWYTGSCGGTLVGTGPSITVSPAGNTTYYVRAEGLCNNTTCVSALVAVNPIPNGNISGTATICPGTSSAISFHFTSGTTPYDISYTDGVSVFNLSGVRDGDTLSVSPAATLTYSFTSITDSFGCNRVSGFLGGALVTVSPAPAFSSAPVVTNVSCFGLSDGSISISASGGTLPFNYSIDSGVTTQLLNVFSGLPSGNYYAYLLDGNGCELYYPLNPVVITQPAVLDVTDSVVDASCGGVFDGKIFATGSGGTAPYSYSLNGGAYQPGSLFSGLSAGTYLIQVRDAHLCTDTISATINDAYVLMDSIVSQTSVTCFGGNDGSVTVNGYNGAAPYSYSKDGLIYGLSNTFAGLTAGSYNIFVRDSRGCSAIQAVLITQPIALNIVLDTLRNGLCSGDSTGGIYVSVSGGRAPYTYLWSNGSTTQDLPSIAPGTYTLTVTDSSGVCTATYSNTITTPPALFFTVAGVQNVRCFGGSNGSIDVTANGGTPGYTYSWSTGLAAEDLLNVPVGIYSVTVTDANGCTKSLADSVQQPALLTVSGVTDSVTCFGGLDGGIDITPAGGTAPYTYVWSNGSTSQDLVSVGAGTYTAVITDANGCNTSFTGIIYQPTRLSLSTSVTDVLCYGGASGSINLTVSGGSLPYGFVWNDGILLEDRNALLIGTYSVVVTDFNGCRDSISAVVRQPDSLTVSSIVNGVSCSGRADGSINLTTMGGTAPLSYDWGAGITSEDRSGLSGGSYSVTITDANSCQLIRTFIIGEPAVLSASIVPGNVTCFGGGNGSADLTVTGGTAPYSYLWNTFRNTEDISGLTAGDYTVIITDANGCTFRDTVAIHQPARIRLSFAVTNNLCSGGSTGAINLTVSGGTSPYTYAWNDGAISEDRVGLAAGTYRVVVVDTNGCSDSASVTIASPAAINMGAVVSDVRCHGDSTGMINLTVTGGVVPYTYNWGAGVTSEDRVHLYAGTYNVTVTDSNGCALISSFTVNEPTPITSTISTHGTTCFAGSDGSLRVRAAGGTGPYSYFWSVFALGDTLSGLRANNYSVLITDFNGCQLISNASITSPASIDANFGITNARCFGYTDGFITTTVSGGTPGYRYSWSTGDTTSSILGLGAGSYVLTVTDTVGCRFVDTALVREPDSLVIYYTIRNVNCYGERTGAIDITVRGGNPPYGYNWTDPASAVTTNQDIDSAFAGIYAVVVNDRFNCGTFDSIPVTQPDSIAVSALINNVTCSGANNGRIDIDISGGVVPYRFNWSTGSHSEDLPVVSGGTYIVTVTDAHGCISPRVYTVAEPAPLVLNMSPINPACHGITTGSLSVSPAGGTAPYSYLWSTFDTTSSLSSLGVGTYTVSVTDANGCTAIASSNISEPAAINISGTVQDLRCHADNSGAVNISVSAGIRPYAYSWTGGSISEDLIGAGAGTYTVVVTDSNGCIATRTFDITEPDSFYTQMAGVNPTCASGNSGLADVRAFGGTPAYSYLWSTMPAQVTHIASELGAGVYFVTVTDKNGCTVSDSVSIQNPVGLLVTLIPGSASCATFNDGNISVSVRGGSRPYNYTLNGTLQTDSVFRGLAPGSYTVLVTDANGCDASATAVVASPAGFAAEILASDPVIARGDIVSLTLSHTSPLPIDSIYWTPDSLIDASACVDAFNCDHVMSRPQQTTTYTVLVYNSNGCPATDTVTVIVRQDQAIFIPTVFSPNGDGNNETFDFMILGAREVGVTVWDRWGEKVYENPAQTNGAGKGWNGTFNGQPAIMDTYTYQFVIRYWDGSTRTEGGAVTLIR